MYFNKTTSLDRYLFCLIILKNKKYLILLITQHIVEK